jgi:hypothetical protein
MISTTMARTTNSDGDFASAYSDYTWLDVSEVTFITLEIGAGA